MTVVAGILLFITLVSYGRCLSDDEDWSVGCYKSNNSNSCFNVTAGDFNPAMNITGEECVRACAALNIGSKLAGLTAGICVCSQSDENCLVKVSNISCLYPSSHDVFYKVFAMKASPSLNVGSSSVKIFEEFNVTVSHADPRCSYTLDFGDGVKKMLLSGKNKSTTTHYYGNPGEYEISLTANAMCLSHEFVKTAVRIKSENLINVSLDCPKDIIELTANESCELSVLEGSGLNVAESGKFITTLPDTVVESVSFPILEDIDEIEVLTKGTYVMPLLPVVNDAVVVAIDFRIFSNETVTIQIWSPKCEVYEKPCLGGCVPTDYDCTGQVYSRQQMLSKGYRISNVSTNSNGSTSYNVTSEFALDARQNITSYLLRLSNPVSVKRGDIIAFHTAGVASIKTGNHNDSYVFFYCGPKFDIGDNVTASPNKTNILPWFRLYVTSPVLLNFPTTPKLPFVHLVFNVSSLNTLNYKVVKDKIEVQERIHGLNILTPVSGVQYPTLENISFTFDVSNGTNVTYLVDFGDGSDQANTTRNQLEYAYKKKTNYTVTVTASNAINCMNISKTITLINDIKNLKFVEDPKLQPGEVDKPYFVNFSLETGDEPTFYVQFGNNISVFLLCDDVSVNKTMRANTSYSEVGTYDIVVIAYSLHGNKTLRINSTVEIMSPVKNLTVYQEKSNSFKLISNASLIKKHIEEPIKLRAEVSSGSPVKYTFTMKGPEGQTSEHSGNRLSYSLTQAGLWKIDVVANNSISNDKRTFEVEVIGRCESTIEIYDKRDKTNPFITNLGNDIRINSDEKFYDESCPSSVNCWRYNWTLHKDDKNPMNQHEQSSTYFFVNKRTLSVGFYRLNLVAVCNGTARSEHTTYFKVDSSNPVAIITGGSSRDVARPKDDLIMVDASKSYNPDVQLFNSSELRFNWSCSTNCSGGHHNIMLSGTNTSKVSINVSMLPVNCTLEVEVQVNTSLGKVASQKQIITIKDEDFPTTEIICRINCQEFVNPTDRLSLKGKCESCKGGYEVTFVWKLFYENDTKYEVSEGNTETGFHKENFVLSANVLQRNTSYKAELKATRNGSISRSVYEFKTPGQITGGNCEISPRNGTSAFTKFRVECKNWIAQQYPLTYKIQYESSVKALSSVSSVRDDANFELILWYYGEESVSPRSILPSGAANKSYIIPVTIEIQGRNGEYVKTDLKVQVRPREVKAEEFSKDIDELEKIDGKKEPQKVTQQIITYAQVLNESSSSVDTTSAKEIREKLIEKLSTVETNTLSGIQQLSDAVKLVTANSTQVTYKTQEISTDILLHTSEKVLSLQSYTGQESDITGRSMLSSSSSILETSLFKGEDTTKSFAPEAVKPNLYGTVSKKGADLKEIGEKTKKIVEKLDEVVKNVIEFIAKHKLSGEKPTLAKAPNFEIKIRKEQKKFHYKGGRINETATENKNGSEAMIFLPRNELKVLDKNYSEGVFSEAIAFKRNPYTWDIENAHYIQPQVFSFTFRDHKGKEISLKNLAEDIEIQLPNDKDNVVYNSLNSSSSNGEFLVYSFRLDKQHYEEIVMIDIKRMEERNKTKHMDKQATFYLKFGSKVSETNYDFKHLLFDVCKNCSKYPIDITKNEMGSIVFIRDAKRLQSAGGVVSVGLMPCPNEKEDNSKSHTCDLKEHGYSVFVQAVSCRYWNDSKWIKDGCRVGNGSTPSRTCCFCNHLTAFSSYIVKPNPLTKFSAEDFRRGYVCFVAVVTIFIIYFLLLIWARKCDRQDCTKVRVCSLADNRPGDRYRYEVAIWTGMRRNAGTGSEVTIILSGDKEDTEARCLINPQNPTFVRGSLEKFLLTSSKDLGSLYCIRVWHDNSHGSWYLSRVMVTDLQKDERYYFICDRWLAVDEDDGQVERLLPVASDEELADFHHLFYSKTKRGLSDTHLWVSVLNRPPQSTFTRVQRLSCCLCMVMTTMFANAMFYEARSEPTADSTNFIGSYSFTWDEVFIGVVSSLIIVPVNVILLNIFRNVRPKTRKNRHQSSSSTENLGSGYYNLRNSHASFETLEESSSQGTFESVALDKVDIYSRVRSAESKKKREEKLSRWTRFKKSLLPSSLPHWFVYVGWSILIIVTLGSATVVVLYGMEFGNGRSLQWLFSIVVSIVEDIFVLQPLKVLVFALAFALLVKKPDEGEFESSQDYDNEDVFIQQGNEKGYQTKAPNSARLPVRPSEEQLAIMRKARMKERKMFFLIQEIIVHIIFMIVVALVTYGHKDDRAVHLYHHIDELSTKTEKLNNFSQLWNWSRVVLLPQTFPETLYNGEFIPTYGFLDDGYNNLISRARMRLLRVNNDSCKIPSEFKSTIDGCLKDYSIFNQDEKCYRSRWEDSGKRKSSTSWCFQNWKDLDGYPTWGIFETYSGSGYISELIPGFDNNKTFNELEYQNWLDEQSRALFVEMTTYNANINLYTSITLLFEFPEFGGIFYFRNIFPMRLKQYVGGFAFFIFICEVSFALFILGYSYIALKKIYRNRMAYFKEFWNIIDFAVLLSSYAVIAVYVYRIHLTTDLMKRVRDRSGEFVNFQYVTYWNEVLNFIIALVVALTTVKLTKLMRFNLRISLFGKTLEHAKPALAGFSIQFGIVFFAYIMVGVLVFGYNVSQFKSIVSAMMALGRVILGKSQFRELFEADPIIGPLFFFTYVMFVCWILITMFVAILNDSYHDVQDKCYGMSNEYEIVDFFLARFRAWSGMGGKKKKRIPAGQRWRQAGGRAKVAAAIGRKQKYIPSEENIAIEKTGDLMERLEDSIRSIEKRVNKLSLHFQ